MFQIWVCHNCFSIITRSLLRSSPFQRWIYKFCFSCFPWKLYQLWTWATQKLRTQLRSIYEDRYLTKCALLHYLDWTACNQAYFPSFVYQASCPLWLWSFSIVWLAGNLILWAALASCDAWQYHGKLYCYWKSDLARVFSNCCSLTALGRWRSFQSSHAGLPSNIVDAMLRAIMAVACQYSLFRQISLIKLFTVCHSDPLCGGFTLLGQMAEFHFWLCPEGRSVVNLCSDRVLDYLLLLKGASSILTLSHHSSW